MPTRRNARPPGPAVAMPLAALAVCAAVLALVMAGLALSHAIGDTRPRWAPTAAASVLLLAALMSLGLAGSHRDDVAPGLVSSLRRSAAALLSCSLLVVAAATVVTALR